MRRRGFLAAVAGLLAAPSLIEKIRVEPRVWRVRKVPGEVEFSGRLLRSSRKVYTGDLRVSPRVREKFDFNEVMKRVYSQPLRDGIADDAALLDLVRWRGL